MENRARGALGDQHAGRCCRLLDGLLEFRYRKR